MDTRNFPGNNPAGAPSLARARARAFSIYQSLSFDDSRRRQRVPPAAFERQPRLHSSRSGESKRDLYFSPSLLAGEQTRAALSYTRDDARPMQFLTCLIRSLSIRVFPECMRRESTEFSLDRREPISFAESGIVRGRVSPRVRDQTSEKEREMHARV
jgi:hypothetical protein